jgi:hypothetical protein
MRLGAAKDWTGLQAGLDLDLNEWRSFNKYKATDIEAHNGTEVDLSVMPKGFDAKGLERQFQADGKLTFRDGNLLVAYEKPVPPRVVFTPFDRMGGLQFRRGDKEVHLTVRNDNRFGILCAYKGTSTVSHLNSNNPTAQDLVNALNWALQ